MSVITPDSSPPDSSQSGTSDFEEGIAYLNPSAGGLDFRLVLDGYEGPLDILLNMAQNQKVDLAQISILQLAEQYLDFMTTAQDLSLEIAADYLVMASWLALLKSRLLLPQAEVEVPSAEEAKAYLLFRLERLKAMRDAVEQLESRAHLGRDIFARGAPEGIRVSRGHRYVVHLFDLLAAYTTRRMEVHHEDWRPSELDVLSLEDARGRVSAFLMDADDWSSFDDYVASLDVSPPRASVLASCLVAALEFAREGRLQLRQPAAFAAVLARRVSS